MTELRTLALQKGYFVEQFARGDAYRLRDKRTGAFARNTDGGASFTLNEAEAYLAGSPDREPLSAKPPRHH